MNADVNETRMKTKHPLGRWLAWSGAMLVLAGAALFLLAERPSTAQAASSSPQAASSVRNDPIEYLHEEISPAARPEAAGNGRNR